MSSKYLYGKRKFLQPIINEVVSPRFSDLSHFSRLENGRIRDDEAYRVFELDRTDSVITINGHQLNPASLTQNPTMSLPTRHCFCLCLSESGNDPLLYETFEADVCIELDVRAFVAFIENAVLPKFPGMQVVANKVSYYSHLLAPPTTDVIDLVFQKDRRFAHEQEYRIALFYPLDRNGFKAIDGRNVPFQLADESLHLTIQVSSEMGLKGLVLNVHQPNR